MALVPNGMQSIYNECEEHSKKDCQKPFTYLDDETLLIIWRIVYWVTYCMCWCVLQQPRLPFSLRASCRRSAFKLADLLLSRSVLCVVCSASRTVYPILQSYALAGGFSVLEKLKTAIVENLLFYGVAGAILLVLLVIIAAKNRLDG
jgi:hypothetical protein